MVRRRRAWHDITALGQHTRLNDVGRGMPSSPWAAQTVERHWVWHDFIAFGQHTRSYEVGHDMPLLPLDSTHTVGLGQQRRAWHDITALGYYTQTDYVKRGMTSPP